ncbi:hypothetical protein EBB07_25255 [Paenibacillaceae bacterium]|nr:hypothetical protein EBB07_25255 [Paenibacillaceae bacterium]
MPINLDKHFAGKMYIMLESQLIWYKHFHLFCDEIIANQEKPPLWIIDLSVTRFKESTVQIVNQYLYSEPFVELNREELCNQYIACLLLRYARREISWATFLFASGQYADGTQGVKEPCEYFFDLLNQYEDSDYDKALESSQQSVLQAAFKDEIAIIAPLYEMFRRYYQQYVQQHA